jgi:V8-like Glu-specific endopeptidase
MRRSIARSLAFFVVITLLAMVIPANAPAAAPVLSAGTCPVVKPTADRFEVGKVLSFQYESPHPLPAALSRTFNFPGAVFLRLHFEDFNLAAGDRLVISSLDGSQRWEYTGLGTNGNGDFWSFATNGQDVKVELFAPSGQSYGFKIVEVGYGTVNLDAVDPQAVNPGPMVVCGTDGREAIACRTNENVINNAQKPVARLLFASGGAQYVCTGELIRGANASTLITNAHCMDTQKEVSTLQAKFNYQYTTCGGLTLAPTTDYAGGTMLKTNLERYNARKSSTTGLDYTLLTLKGNPEASWGELIPTTRDYSTGTQLNFIQHPGGNPKKIGYWEDSAHTVRCKVDTINATYGSAAPNSQLGYGCDSEGGSSGSAITAASDGKVIGLHHYGGVATCLNSGTMMVKICDNAGSLLICDSN